MKRGNTSLAILLIVAVVLGLGLVLVINNNSSPTGYTGVTGRVVLGPSTFECTSNTDCVSYECNSGQLPICNFGSCTCIAKCQEGSLCDTSPSQGEVQCGGAFGNPISPSPCLPNNPVGPFEPEGIDVSVGQNQGACDCDNDGCTEGAQCSTFGVLTNGDSFPNPCGPNGHCVPTGSSGGGLLYGECACGKKPCQYLDAEGFEGDVDKCPNTMRCEKGKQCTSHNDCGGVGVGRCAEGVCDCECVSWAPCQNDDDCGSYGEDGNYGDCMAGPDGTLECMCSDNLGCSPKDCVPDVTPCTDESSDCGGNGDNCEAIDGQGICSDCGFDCVLNCGDGDCSEADCADLEVQLGSDCTQSESHKCACPGIPLDLCVENCFTVVDSTSACGPFP